MQINIRCWKRWKKRASITIQILTRFYKAIHKSGRALASLPCLVWPWISRYRFFKGASKLSIIKKLFGGITLTWKKVILFAVAAGIYTAVMALLPAAKDTSFADITISFEVWILFGIIIIMNSRSPKDSALKCFVFFLISQPLVYLIQVPFSSLGWGILGYYRYWFIWTLLTIPMGFVGYYMKQEKWWGLLILTPVLIFLGFHYSNFFALTRYYFPHHVLSAVFCVVTLLLYPIYIFQNPKFRKIGIAISVLIIFCASAFALTHRNVYNTTVLVNGGSTGAVFDDTYSAYLKDDSFGKVHIDYNAQIEDYMVNAEFIKGGRTELILADSSGIQTVFELNIGYSSFDIMRK